LSITALFILIIDKILFIGNPMLNNNIDLYRVVVIFDVYEKSL